MKRRKFLYLAGSVSVLPKNVLTGTFESPENIKPEIKTYGGLLLYLLRLNDLQVPKMLGLQDKNEKSLDFGGLADGFGIYNAGSTTGLIKVLATSFTQKESKFYLDATLGTAMVKAAIHLLKMQHSDGTIDLVSTNFHSTPDTGFVVEPICASFVLLQRTDFSQKEILLSLLGDFLKKAGKAFIKGGVHTPNHRWVVCMAMARINSLFPDNLYEKRIQQWLDEGIDLDPDGQFEEKSTYIYSPLTNRCLVSVAKFSNKPELLAYVRKNLEMTLFYLRPNGEIVTEASGRQDQFQIGFPENYYLPLRYLSILDKNPRFAALTLELEKRYPEKLQTWLTFMLEDSFYSGSMPSEESLPDNYEKEFNYSNLVRIRRGNTDATLLGNNPTFFTLSKGKAVLASVRLATAFFGRGQFKSSKIEKNSTGYVLEWNFSWGYFQPLPKDKKPDYNNPFDEDRKRREPSEMQEMNIKVTVSENKKGVFYLDFELNGTENVPFAIEFAFRKGGIISGTERIGNDSSVSILKKGNCSYKFESEEITIGPGNDSHNWTNIRGGLPKPDADCVYITGFSPFRKIVTIS